MTKEEAIKLISDIINSLDEVGEVIRDIYSKTEDRNLKIYMDKKYFGLSNIDLELKYGIGKRQINKICKKIDKSSPLVPTKAR